MKKLFSLFLVFILALSCSMMLVACKPDKPGDGDGDSGEQLTRAEIATIYKEVAQKSWQKIGYQDVVQPSLMSAIPDKKVETTDAQKIANIKGNAKSAIGVVYMIGLLYENDAFILTNGIAKFNAVVSLFGMTVNYSFTLKTSLDIENDKVYLESISGVSEFEGSEQYCYAEIDYDFDSKEVKAFNFISIQGNMAVDMALTLDGRYMWYEGLEQTDTFVEAVLAQKQQFASSCENDVVLEGDFGVECQVYFNILQGAVDSVG